SQSNTYFHRIVVPYTIHSVHRAFSLSPGDHRDLHPFPTRRSSDLPRLGNKIDNAFAHALDGVDAVMQKINLTLTFELTIDRVPDNSFVVTADDRFHRQTVERWRLDRRHVFDADERKIKRARNWRGRKREHV